VDARTIPDGPPPGSRYRLRPRLFESLRDLWSSREVVYSLTERDVRSRYKQATFGIAWSVINPVALMLVFAFFIKSVAHIDTQGKPYALFAYLGLLPWTFFSTALSTGGISLLMNTSLLNKVRCPREVFPLSAVGVATFDGLIATGAFVVLMAITRTAPASTFYWIPLFLLIQYVFTTGVVLLFSILVIYFRDLRHALPPVLQVGIFATPVAYGVAALSGSVRPWYAAVNPLAAVIDGYRRAILFGTGPDWGMTIPAMISSVVVLLGAYLVFKRMEAGIADIA
jgi:ABC-2 type transport system permease protein/lipopolysaccharide transport system permease protein